MHQYKTRVLVHQQAQSHTKMLTKPYHGFLTLPFICDCFGCELADWRHGWGISVPGPCGNQIHFTVTRCPVLTTKTLVHIGFFKNSVRSNSHIWTNFSCARTFHFQMPVLTQKHSDPVTVIVMVTATTSVARNHDDWMARVTVTITVRDSERLGWFSGWLGEMDQLRRRATSKSQGCNL